MVLKDSVTLREYDREKVLSTCREEFITDFEFADIRKELETENVFSIKDLDSIRKMKNEEERIDRLLFLLVIKSQKQIDKFVGVLRKKYLWLADSIQEKLNEQLRIINARDEDDYYEKILNLRKELPGFADGNIHRSEFVSIKFLHHLHVLSIQHYSVVTIMILYIILFCKAMGNSTKVIETRTI